MASRSGRGDSLRTSRDGSGFGARVRALGVRVAAARERWGAPRFDERIAPPPVVVLGPPGARPDLVERMIARVAGLRAFGEEHAASPGNPSEVERRQRGESGGGSVGSAAERRARAPVLEAEYWGRFFPPGEHRASETWRMRRMRRSIGRWAREAGVSVVFADPRSVGRLAVLAEWMPEAVFVVARAGTVWGARSELSARLAVTGDVGEAWSIDGPGASGVQGLPPEVEAIEQMVRTYEAIDAARDDAGAERIVEVDVERLAEEPAAELGEVMEALAERGVVGSRPGPGEGEGEAVGDPIGAQGDVEALLEEEIEELRSGPAEVPRELEARIRAYAARRADRERQAQGVEQEDEDRGRAREERELEREAETET